MKKLPCKSKKQHLSRNVSQVKFRMTAKSGVKKKRKILYQASELEFSGSEMLAFVYSFLFMF